MPINKKRSSLYVDRRLGAPDLLPGAVNGNKVDVHLAKIATAAGDDATSTYQVASLPADCYLHEIALIHGIIPGGTSVTLSAAGATKPLAAAMDLATAASVRAGRDGMSGVAFADNDLPLWQMLGLSARPAAVIDLVLTANTNITGAGTIFARIYSSSAD